MKEVLSQTEIDNLLNALASGELKADEVDNESTEKKEYKKYDFRRPNKFTKDQLRTLHMIHDNFARMLSNYLSGYLRTSVSISIISVDQLTYEDFLVSIPSPTLFTIFEMEPLIGNAVLNFNTNFTFPIIDLLFGGLGRKVNETRNFTDIEIRVLKKIIQKILDNMAFAWADVFEFNPKIENLESNPQFNQIISPNETVAIITLTSDITDNQGIINICLPFITLEKVVSKLTARYWFAGQEQDDYTSTKDEIKNRLDKVPLTLTAVCGKVDLTVRDFLELSVGDVIPLETGVEDDMNLLVENQPKYKVQPGMVGNKLAVQVMGKY